MSKKNAFTNTNHTNSIVSKREENNNVKIINNKKYTLVGEDKTPIRVEPSINSVTRV